MSTTTPSSPKLVTTAATSAHTGLADSTIRRLVREGLPCVRVGSKLYFDLARVDAWLDARADAASAAATAAGATRPDPTVDAYRAAIKRLVDDAPPLTADQAARIRAVLGGAA